MTRSLAILGARSGLLATPRSTSQSASGDTLVRMREDVRKHLLESYSVRHELERSMAELIEVQDAAATAGWDGYGAKPVDLWACVHAQLFIEALPTTVPGPEISADPDGEVALEWVFGPRKALSVSIGPSGRCSFAWMRGQGTYRGTEWLNDGIPQNIIAALAELARDSATQHRLR